MRIAIISDIHANFHALQAVEDLVREADAVIALGDYVGYYCQVNEVLDFVRSLDARCLLGNHEAFLLRGCPERANEAVRFGIEHADRVITQNHREWLATLPLLWGGDIGGRSMLLCHGSPWRPLEDYLYPNSPSFQELFTFEYDFIAFGQTHRPFVKFDGRPKLINPGSVGQARHAPGTACLVILDTETMEETIIERAYDPAPVIAQAREAGAGDWITKHLADQGDS
jgi:predicted phosphodiesterase